MVTKVSGFQAEDGTLFDTLELAVAHESKGKVESTVVALIEALGLGQSNVVATDGITVILKDFLVDNRAVLVEALSIVVPKPERKPRVKRETVAINASANGGSGSEGVAQSVAQAEAAVEKAVETVTATASVDPLDELAASLASAEVSV